MMKETMIQPDIALQKALEQNEARYWQILYTHSSDQRYFTDVKIIGGAVAGLMPEVDVLACNRVIGLGIHTPATEAQIDGIIDAYKSVKVPRFFVQVSPYAQPENIQEMLKQKGFSHYNNWAKLYRKAEVPLPLVQTDLTVVSTN
jgi:hypothetical protein